MVYVQQRVSERAATTCITPTVKHGGGFVMVCFFFINWKVGDLHLVKGKLNQTVYHSILQHNAIPSGKWLVGQGFVLMQDTDPIHTIKLCQKYIKSQEEQLMLQLMSWLVQSVDLNPIELWWDEVGQRVRAKQPTSAAHLWQLLQESWAELFSVNSSLWWKECRESVIADKGDHFDESKV